MPPSFDILTPSHPFFHELHLHGQQAACMRVVWGSGSFSQKTEIGYFPDANAAITQAQISILSVLIPTSAIPYPHVPPPPPTPQQLEELRACVPKVLPSPHRAQWAWARCVRSVPGFLTNPHPAVSCTVSSGRSP